MSGYRACQDLALTIAQTGCTMRCVKSSLGILLLAIFVVNLPEELIEEVQARARMSTLQRDELLTQSEILDKETSPTAKEVN